MRTHADDPTVFGSITALWCLEVCWCHRCILERAWGRAAVNDLGTAHNCYSYLGQLGRFVRTLGLTATYDHGRGREEHASDLQMLDRDHQNFALFRNGSKL